MKRIKQFTPEGTFVSERYTDRTGPRGRMLEQRAWIEYRDICKALGLPVLWESPLVLREAWEIGKKYNGGKKHRATKREMQERANHAKQ